MKQKEEKKIKNKRISISLLQLGIIIGCIVIFYIIMTPKDRVKDTTYSYSKLEEVKEYKVEENYITRVRPLTEYKTFKETVEYTLNNNQEGKTYTIKVYTDLNKTQEVTEGYIVSGMVLEGIPNSDETTNETVTYTISVIGDFTKDGDIGIGELTKIIKGVVGLNNWRFTEEEKLIADFNGDKEVNVVDIEECINYIVYGRLTLENGTKLKATDEYGITWNYTYQSGEATDVHYESGDLKETVNIPAYLDGYLVVSLYNSSLKESMPWNEEETESILSKEKNEVNTMVEKVIIPNTVTKIGSNAFEQCIALKEIEMSDNVNSIGNNAFYKCSNLVNVEIPHGVTSIKYSTFNDCTGLTQVTMPEALTNIGNHAFQNCTSLTSIEIPNSVKSIDDLAFAHCTGLVDIQIPDSVISIGSDAFGNTAWYSNQPDGVVYAGKVAYSYKGEMKNDTSIEFKEGTKGIAGGGFEQLKELTEIIMPNSVINIGSWAFWGCTSLKSAKLSEGNINIGDSAFRDCTNLINIDIPDSVTDVGYDAFYNTAWYNNQEDSVIYIGKIAYHYKGTMPSNECIEIKEGTTSISSKAFFQQEGLTEIIIPDSVTKIEENAFLWCRKLTAITMSKNLEYIGEGAFAGCTSLENIVIWKNVDEVGKRTFSGWSEEQTVNIEAEEILSGWHEEWNKECNAKIVYGYTGD